jgi:precorrin-2/cobalt-factor-2 C20-methyltransferase
MTANYSGGRLYGLGIGPGDPELITLKALRLLQAAPVVAYPAPDTGESLARAIVAPYLKGGQTEIAIRVPMVTARFPAQEVYDRAAEDLGAHLEAGRDVAVLCEGDPFFYGSFMYLFGRMAERFPVEVVPGVSSLTACAATLGTPLAARNDVLTVLPAPLDVEILRKRLEDVEAAAIIKIGRHFGKVKTLLEEMGLSDRAHYIERATMETQRILSLDEVSEDGAPYFSMILIHRRGEAWT